MFDSFQDILSDLIAKLRGWVEAIILNLPNIILAALVMVAGIFAARFVQRYVKRVLNKFTDNKTVTGFASSIITALFIIGVLLTVLSILKLSTALSAILGTAGVAGLAVGLALQDPIINVFSGIVMSVKEYYKVGDLVKTNDYFGTIQRINLRSTIILTPEGQEVIMPNKDVLNNPLVNFSHTPARRVDINCGVAYGDDLEEVQRTVIEAIKSDVDYDTSKPIQCYFTEFGDSSINFQLRYWENLHGQAQYLDKRSQGIIAIKKAFDKKGITIPFPIRTLDFGVVGGLPINEIYKPEEMGFGKSDKSNGRVSENKDS